MQEANGLTLIRWIGIAMCVPVLFAVILLRDDVAHVVDAVDRNAFEREAAAIDHGVHLLGELGASEQVSLSMWDEAFQNVVVAPKPAWIKANFGREAYSEPDQQRLLIVAANGKPLFASELDGPPPADRAAPILAAAAPLMERVRSLYRAAVAAGDSFDERRPGALTDGIYAHDTAVIGGRPALITVSPFTADVADIAEPKEPTLLIGIQFMTEKVLARLATMAHLGDLRLVVANAGGAGSVSTHQIRNGASEPVATVTWAYQPPGTAVLRAAGPAIAASLALLALLTLTAAVAIRRMAQRLAASELTARHASHHDAATGLANRGWFMTEFARALKPSSPHGDGRAVLLIDCDYFKSINDTLGHAAGDAVLLAIANRLKGLGDRLTIAARLGGDEFALLSAPIEDALAATALLDDIARTLMQPVVFDGHVIEVGVSLGAALFAGAGGGEVDALLAKADLALYRAKHDGRGCARLYDPALDTGAAFAAALPRTAANGQSGDAPSLIRHFQPSARPAAA